MLLNLPDQKFVHLTHGQRFESQAGFSNLREKLMNRFTAVGDRSRRQATFTEQVLGKLSDLLGIRLPNRHGCLQPSQECQPSNGMAPQLATFTADVAHRPWPGSAIN